MACVRGWSLCLWHRSEREGMESVHVAAFKNVKGIGKKKKGLKPDTV